MHRIMYVVSGLCLLGLAVAVVPLVHALHTEESYFRGNLLPELIGFLADGLLFVGILSLLQRANERTERARLLKTIQEELAFCSTVLMNCLRQSELGDQQLIDYGSDETLSLTMSNLQTTSQQRRIDDHSSPYPDDAFSAVARSASDALYKKASVHRHRLEPLTAITAQFGPAFLSEWQSLRDCLYSLGRAESFDHDQIDTWGANMPYEYWYGKTVDLFRHLHVLRSTSA
jgi:hypothetical protein